MRQPSPAKTGVRHLRRTRRKRLVDTPTPIPHTQRRNLSQVTPDEHWLAEMWRFVDAAVPPAPADVLEIGCGPLGGFVPALLADGYHAVGVDPEAPHGPHYHRCEFEQYQPPRPVNAVVACTSLHHVTDLDVVLDGIAAALAADGTMVVVEWAPERFDEKTARWCFARVTDQPQETGPGWLQKRRDEHAASGQTWETYFRSWAERERLHTGEQIVRALDGRFERVSCAYGPYLFADLAATSAADEQAAIDTGEIEATGIHYTARLRSRPRP